jgi:NAD-dependent DNA ligase
MVAKLYDAGFTSVGALLSASCEDFMRVDGCGQKMCDRLYAGLRANRGAWNELTYMLASCKLPRGTGKSKLQTLLRINPDPRTWVTLDLMAAQPAGLSQKSVEAIVATIPDYVAWRTANIPVGAAPAVEVVVTKEVAAAPAGPLLCVVMTGFRDKDLETALTTAGHSVGASITKKTTHVIHPDTLTRMSEKITKAREQGIQVMALSEFRRVVLNSL